jgi:hypothetical protein
MKYLFMLFIIILSINMANSVSVGPRLDEGTGTVVITTGLPVSATWPILRYEKPLRVLVVASKGASIATYQRVCRRMRAELDVRYIGGGDDIYHVNDKWIEPQKDPTYQELKDATINGAINAVGSAYDVIICDNPDNILKNGTMQDSLIKFVTDGGTLVVTGNIYPDAASALGKEWPAKPTNRNTWMQGGAVRKDDAELAGIPVERLSGHNWIAIAEATTGSTALATGETGALFKRIVGKGTILYCPMGLISRKYNVIQTIQRNYDHDEIWLRLWDQVLYSIVRGDVAIPAFADVKSGLKEAEPGKEYIVPVKIYNRTSAGPLTISTHVTTPRGTVVYKKEETITMEAGKDLTMEMKIPVAPEWVSGLYPIYVTVADTAKKKQYQQGMSFIPVTGTLNLTMASEKKGYKIGEEAKFILTASAKSPWKGKLRFGVFDFRGNLLNAKSQDVELNDKPQQIAFTYKLADYGVKVDVYWAQVDAITQLPAKSIGKSTDVIWGQALAKCNKYEPWSMRNEYQWSTWAGVACAAPSLVPMGMRMMAFAGMNALGYPGRSELSYAAERWGWRYYNEGIGMNTFAPVIEYENDAEIETQLLKEAKSAMDNPDMNSAAFVLCSVGEEAGFKNGWGTRYYWDTPKAPEKACKALQWYLKTKYPDLNIMNSVWKTNYKSWDEVKLTKEFSSRAPKLEADGWAHPKDSPMGEGIIGVSLAPYKDTEDFYNWYYDRIIVIARKILREKINPVSQIMSSAPTIGTSNVYDVRLSGPGCWNESQAYTLNTGEEPGYGLIWGHFDWNVMSDNMLWGFLLQRSGHNNYWVDIPLMFNSDLSLTRATMSMRRWTTKLAGHERVILDSKPFVSEVGVLDSNGLSISRSPNYMTDSVKVALQQAGFGFANASIDDLKKYKIVIAVSRQAVSPADAEKMNAYVEAGGTLIFTPRFASQTEFGAPQPVSPGNGLADKWGFTVTGKTENIPMYHSGDTQSFSIDGLGNNCKGTRAAGIKVFREIVKSDGWTQVSAFDDKTPAILTRTLGKGKLVYVNAIYQSHWYIQWVTPTGAERQGFYKMIEQLCSQAGAYRTLKMDGDMEQVLHTAVQQFTDPTGKINYAILRTNGEVPWVNAKCSWLGSQKACYDILGGEVGKPVQVYGNLLYVDGIPNSGMVRIKDSFKTPNKNFYLNLKPGSGKLLAFTAELVAKITVSTPNTIFAGSPVKITVNILDAAGKPVPGAFPLTITVKNSSKTVYEGSVSLESGQSYTFNTILNDTDAIHDIIVTDGITGLSGTTRVTRKSLIPTPPAAPAFAAWGWPSEILEPVQMSGDTFITRLKRLVELYQKDHSGDGWMAKQNLCAFYDYFPGTRHDIIRPLNDVDWTKYTADINRAVNDGATIILTGEDVNIDPGSGLAIWPHYDGKQITALTTALRDAKWTIATADGDTIVANLGKGKVILCRESIDAAGNTNPEAIRWSQRWQSELAAMKDRPVLPNMSIEKLTDWWSGRTVIANTPRTISWLSSNWREQKLSLDSNKHLGEVISIAVPDGTIKSADILFTPTKGDGKIFVDIGCDDTIDMEISGGQATVNFTAAISKYLTWKADGITGPYRDGNNWRIVPIRLTTSSRVDVTVGGVKVVLQ